ncbi:MAG: LLM class F420-dependent oxidoreductase [Chloroflexota bacterium]|nr:LLM class F420-dependent oxidoreductase [Chloroflexota bacterium]
MQLGVVFPQTEIGSDPGCLRDYAQAAESLGYSHLLAYEHVVGAGIANRPGWAGPYTEKDMFHEPFVLFGYLAAVTQRIGLVTGVVILPQRQTALVAKQAAEVDLLSHGRLRLGVGVGWNPVEYEALGLEFRTRGKRIEEQIILMRKLWTEPLVSFDGRWEKITDAGINPMPVQHPIPVWIGGYADVVLERIGRIGDGWFPQGPPDAKAGEQIQKLRDYTERAGRDPNSVGIEARLNLKGGTPESWKPFIEGWQGLGATHLSINTMGMGLHGYQHIEAIERFMKDMGN